MNYKNFTQGFTDIFTEYDDNIAAEIARDPLGLQVIWTDYGQRIFKNRTTSIATDIRNYTINLFHHYVINTWFKEEPAYINDIITNSFLKNDKNSSLNRPSSFYYAVNL